VRIIRGTEKMLDQIVLKELKEDYQTYLYGANALYISLKSYLMGKLEVSEEDSDDFIHKATEEVSNDLKADPFYLMFNDFVEGKLTYKQLLKKKEQLESEGKNEL